MSNPNEFLLKTQSLVKASRIDAHNKRIERNKKARSRRWSKTGVSQSTINWMNDRDML